MLFIRVDGTPMASAQTYDFSPVTTIIHPFEPISQLQGVGFSPVVEKSRFI
jgi:hypothetical protein